MSRSLRSGQVKYSVPKCKRVAVAKYKVIMTKYEDNKSKI